ncbi:MAG: hypothetical protein JWM55_1047 [Acidimicrobiaceae bacterium]|nr:hypothetical protein [Acidimicrobiaceae bacterium]
MDFAMLAGTQQARAIIFTQRSIESERDGRFRQTCGRSDLFPSGDCGHFEKAVHPMVLGVGAYRTRNAHRE